MEYFWMKMQRSKVLELSKEHGVLSTEWILYFCVQNSDRQGTDQGLRMVELRFGSGDAVL